MNLLRSHYTYKSPLLALISGLLSPFFLWVKHLLTDELTLKAVAGVGVWTAAIVGVLSAFIYMVKVYDIAKSRLMKKERINNDL